MELNPSKSDTPHRSSPLFLTASRVVGGAFGEGAGDERTTPVLDSSNLLEVPGVGRARRTQINATMSTIMREVRKVSVHCAGVILAKRDFDWVDPHRVFAVRGGLLARNEYQVYFHPSAKRYIV